MKIIQAFDFISLSNGGGTTAVVHYLSKSLSNRGHEVAIYTSDFGVHFIDILQGVKIHPFHCISSMAGFYLTPSMISEAREHLMYFDVIHLHCFRNFPNIVIHHYAKKYGIPYVLDTHGSLPRKVNGESGLRWLFRWIFDITYGNRILRDASKVIAETEVGVSEYKEFGIDDDKITLIPPLFSTNEYSNLPPLGLFRSKYNIKENHIVLFMGIIRWIKGLEFLVVSFNELTKSRDDVILVIAGSDDGYKSALDKLIKKLGLSDKVLFTGFLDGVDKLSALVDADVVVQPSVYEYGTAVPFQAIMCNTPIIVSKNTGGGENVSRIDAGYLVEYGDKKELSDTIEYVLDNPTEAQEKTQRTKEYIKSSLSLENCIEKYEELYREVIESEFTRIS